MNGGTIGKDQLEEELFQSNDIGDDDKLSELIEYSVIENERTFDYDWDTNEMSLKKNVRR